VAKPLVQIEIKKFSNFIDQIEGLDPWECELVLFRGQCVKGNLLPSVARQTPKNDTTTGERDVLEQFRLLGASMLSASEVKDLDLLVIAQHYGMKTRLLDWTTSPLAALWFACAAKEDGDAFVYMLRADSLIQRDLYSKDPFAPDRTRVFQPRHNNPRVVAQDGWFTLHRYSRTAKRFVPLEENPETSKYITELRIPSERRMFLLNSLERHGVTSKTLYPDLSGLCQHLNRKHWGA
jgi:FRG domain